MFATNETGRRRVTTNTAKAFTFGEVLGHVELGQDVTQKAAKFASDHYLEQDAIDFSGENVESFSTPTWAPKRESWLPTARISELGYQIPEEHYGAEMVVTLGVDQHIDGIHGPVLCLVLHNDGLTFKQGKVSHKPLAGDWFIFNDRASHGVKEAKGAAVFAALVVPLENI